MPVTWDRDGRATALSIHQYGSATLDATSPHYVDQGPLSAALEMKPVWFDEADVRANLEREYRPGGMSPGPDPRPGRGKASPGPDLTR